MSDETELDPPEPPLHDREPPTSISPTSLLPQERAGIKEPEEGMGLCLSGGGYRAMLFHTGVLIRLNELGILRALKRVSSVSGGSITAGTLGLKWNRLKWETRTIPASGDAPARTIEVAANLDAQVVQPIRGLARHTIDVWAVTEGVLLPFVSISDRVQSAYGKYLFGKATLQDLPSDAEGPRFVINATNVQSGVLWRFSRPYMADYRVGMVKNPTIPLTLAVAASSAFPPILAPARMKLPAGLVQKSANGNEDLFEEPYTTDVVLADGGVYDNLGLETVWKRYKTVFVSDGGGQLGTDPKPHGDWLSVTLRVLNMLNGQVCSLRKRQIVDSLVAEARSGAYWRTRSPMSEFTAPGTLPCPLDRTTALAQVDTRLKALKDTLQERLINWGYAVSDASIRTWYDKTLPPPAGFPYPKSAV